MSNKFANIEQLNAFTFMLGEDGYDTLILSDVEDDGVMQNLIDWFLELITEPVEWDPFGDIDYDKYNVDEFVAYAKSKWIFIYSPQAQYTVQF